MNPLCINDVLKLDLEVSHPTSYFLLADKPWTTYDRILTSAINVSSLDASDPESTVIEYKLNENIGELVINSNSVSHIIPEIKIVTRCAVDVLDVKEANVDSTIDNSYLN